MKSSNSGPQSSGLAGWGEGLFGIRNMTLYIDKNNNNNIVNNKLNIGINIFKLRYRKYLWIKYW